MTVFLSKKSNILMNTTSGMKTFQLYNLGLSQFKNPEESSRCLTLPLSCLCPSFSFFHHCPCFLFFISLPIFISRHLPPPFIHFLLSLSLHLFISFLISSHLFSYFFSSLFLFLLISSSLSHWFQVNHTQVQTTQCVRRLVTS